MPKRRVERTLEEEEEFQRRRLERKAENQRHRREITKAISNNSNINSTNVAPLYQNCAENQSRYRSRQKNQPRLINDNTLLISNVVEYYISSMDVSCVHCNAKHFAAEKISNRESSFHDCCNHGAVYLQPLPEHNRKNKIKINY